MKLFLTTIICFGCLNSFGQVEPKKEVNFNRWSIEVNVGQNKPIRPFASGYYSAKPDTYFYFSGVQHKDVGARYMFSNVFGLKLDFAFDEVKNQKGSGSLDFQLNQYRIGIQGVANLGRVLRFETFTSRIGLLAHGGIQVARLQAKTGINQGHNEDNGGIIMGLTPQYKITNWLALTGDFSVINNVRQHFNWDGTYAAENQNLSGMMYNTSLGVTFYIGAKEKHADWYLETDKTKDLAGVDKEARKRLDSIETLMNDSDRDGVPDYLDSEFNTPAGVTVDTRGKFIDLNKNGVPDELERYGSRTTSDVIFNSNPGNDTKETLQALVESGLINIFYDVNKDVPNSGATNSLFQIIEYLKNFDKTRIKLVGYADVNGNETDNKALAERRSLKLKTFIIACGINENRIDNQGVGVDNNYPGKTKLGLKLSRRVSISLIKE